MARLSAAERAKLPDRAFAHIDSNGRRLLPIYDEAHVRNAVARFNQVDFADDEARDRARQRLLAAAKRFRIVPVGFIGSQLRSERALGAMTAGPALPRGFVTLLMTDIEGSTGLLHQLGDAYAAVLDEVRELQRAAIEARGGTTVDARGDELFAAFESPCGAVEAAVDVQRQLPERQWPGGVTVKVREGLHAGYPTVSGADYVGMAVHTVARICAAAHGGQVVVSGDTRTALSGMVPERITLRSLGTHHLRGIPDEIALFQLGGPGLERRFPPLRLR
jgi:class 3 adenylate cyclase